jgi:rhamnose utilization protein RhaD (predicted bifunctional aldolase and dehydrogenase)
MENGLKQLVDISRLYGIDPEFVIAGGGNTSFKDDSYLWIKASGTSLATITEDGFVKMDRKGLARIAGNTYSTDALKREAEIIKELFACVADKSDKRPSVETSLHNLLDFKYVVHTHPTLVNGLLCAKNSRKETSEIFGSEVLIIEYTDPGYILFKLVERNIHDYVKKFGKEPQIIFLENHGVFVAANTIKEIENLYEELTNLIRGRINSDLPSTVLLENDLQNLTEFLSGELNLIAKGFSSKLIKSFTKDQETFREVDTAFSPDNIVYCKAHYMFSATDPKILLANYLAFKANHGYGPKVIGIENKGIICLEETAQSVNTVYEVFLDLMKISFYTGSFGGPRFMTPEQIEFIDNWEVENYRRKVAKT